MSTPKSSRATLQDVLKAIDVAPGLSTKRKQDLRSALRLIAKVLGADPQLIVADPRGIGRRLDGISHLRVGVSEGRWANSRSLLRSSLKLVVTVMAGASTIPILPEWEPLAEESRKVGSCWLRLSRLLRWLSEQLITPDAVTRDDLDRFHAAFLTDTLIGNAERSWQAARQSWERMRLSCPKWPQIELAATPNPMLYSLAWHVFPLSLKAEVDELLERLGGKDLSYDGPASPLRPQTLKMRKHELRSFASALVHQGADPQAIHSLAVCLSLENYKRGLQWFYERAGSKPTHTVRNLAAHLKAIAKHWLKADEPTLGAMSKVIRRLAPHENGMSAKNRDRMRPFESPEQLRELVMLPQTIRRHIETSKNAKTRKTGMSSAAIAIELLIVAPIRLSNLCQLHLDRNFIKVGDKVHLFIPKEEVKNRQDIEFALPSETVALRDWYVTNCRKAEPENRFLFVGAGPGHKDLNTLRLQIMETVKAFTGLTVNPHLFRHIAGSIYLQEHPGAYEVVRQVLGHRNIATTTKFYTAQEDRRARLHFIETVQKLRTEQNRATKHRVNKL